MHNSTFPGIQPYPQIKNMAVFVAAFKTVFILRISVDFTHKSEVCYLFFFFLIHLIINMIYFETFYVLLGLLISLS